MAALEWRWAHSFPIGSSLEDRRPQYKYFKRDVLNPAIKEINASTDGQIVVPEIFISAVICAFHAAKSHSFRTPRLSFKRSPGRLAAKAGQNRRGIVPFARHKKIALRKGTPFLAIMRSSHLML